MMTSMIHLGERAKIFHGSATTRCARTRPRLVDRQLAGVDRGPDGHHRVRRSIAITRQAEDGEPGDDGRGFLRDDAERGMRTSEGVGGLRSSGQENRAQVAVEC